MAEDQLGPVSPGISLFEEHGKLPNNTIDTGASRRIRPGTKAEDMAEGPPLIELQDIDSAFQLTEHLKALHYHHTHPPDSDALRPITAEIAKQLVYPPANTSRQIWLYELGRFLIQKTNSIIVALFADTPPCSPQTCSEMRASEWQYLCAVHDPPKSCAAIDYCCHTLDWAATTLTSSKNFPSRLNLGSGAVGQNADKVLQHQIKELTNIFRRVYRIYAHAWFQHREMFWRVEGKTGLYVLFKTVCDEYGLIQAENYTIPPEAEGLEPEDSVEGEVEQPRNVLARQEQVDLDARGGEEPAGNTVLAAGDTTKRHRRIASEHGPSIANVVIKEEEEEELEEDKAGSHIGGRGMDEHMPDLEQHVMDMKSFAESLPQPGPKVWSESDEVAEQDHQAAGEAESDETEQESLPGIGLSRSDTVKPQRDVVEEIPAEETEEVETTVVEIQPEEEETEAVGEDGGVEREREPEHGKVEVEEVMEPGTWLSHQEAEEARKSGAE
ncbi:hypothetical protein LTR62_004781 [Meristemomyces frigidus]|uniref:Mob1/phocein n=1 Tax=Meristemomyces frigidus TaxID=1508187 RepID=A0AAN7THA7_9PEZI|nr:hypothetical protein LTR62_004781 [Meristemomyces frigidus]